MRLCLCSLCHYEQTACVLVNSVYKSYLGVVDVIFRMVFQVPRDGVEKRAVPVAEARMHHETCRLVYHHQVIVLIHDVEWNVLSRDVSIVVRTVEHHLNDVERLNLVTALHRLTVDHDEAGVGCLLHSVA